MRRLGPILIAAFSLLVAPAGAKVVEVGQSTDGVQPSCPAKPCLAISHTTGFQAKVGAVQDFTRVPDAGRLVAFTLAMGKPDDKQIAFFDKTLGGAASARISVLKQGRDHKHYRLLAQSPAVKLAPYFGQSAQFPLEQSLPVAKGTFIALTVPTWAPALAVGLNATDAWRSSRAAKKCDDTLTQSAQEQALQVALYSCRYRTARITYSATVITDPVANPPPK